MAKCKNCGKEFDFILPDDCLTGRCIDVMLEKPAFKLKIIHRDFCGHKFDRSERETAQDEAGTTWVRTRSLSIFKSKCLSSDGLRYEYTSHRIPWGNWIRK